MKKQKNEILQDQLIFEIENGNYELGSKLPSLRYMAKEYNLSIQTVMLAYHKLEEKGYLTSKERSGYRVSKPLTKSILINESIKCTGVLNPPPPTTTILDEFFYFSRQNNYTNFGSLVPHSTFFNFNSISREIRRKLNNVDTEFLKYGEPQGDPQLRNYLLNKYIKKRNNNYECFTTNGTLNSIFLSLSSICSPGDFIAIEEPYYFGFKYMLESLNLKIVAIKSSVHKGISSEQLKNAYNKHKFKAAILVSSFSNPTGSLVPNSEKEKIVELANKLNFYIIEDDVYGELYFGNTKPKAYLSYDSIGKVIYCNSISKTISPSLKVGWVIYPIHLKKKILNLKHGQLGSTSPVMESIVFNLIRSKKINLKARRSAYCYSNNIKMVQNFFEVHGKGYFKTSNPRGGFSLWVQGPKQLNTEKLYKILLKEKIVIAPGTLFSSKKSYNHFFRINCAFKSFEDCKKSIHKIIQESFKLLED